MQTPSIARFLCCAVLAGAASISAAFAQQRTDGPYAGVLGGPADADRVQGLDLQGSLFGAWDENRFPSGSGDFSTDPRLRESGSSAGASASLNYDYRGDHARFGMNGGADARQYASTPDLISAYHGSATLSADISHRLGVNIGGDAVYSPFYSFSPFTDSAAAAFGPAIDPFTYASLAQRNMSFGGSAGATANLTKRTTLTFGGTEREWRLLDDPSHNMRMWSANVDLRHKITRKLGVHLGYGRGENQYATAGVGVYALDTIDAGVDYGDTLTIGRRAAFSFSTSVEGIRYAGEQHYRANGAATLTRGIGRSWSTWLGYTRNIDYQLGFLAPLLNDTANAGISGLLTRQLQWSAGLGGTLGTVGFGGNRFTTYSADTRLDWAVTRNLALYQQYVYYYYDMPSGASVWTLAPRFSRQVVMVGIRAWVPFINDVRPPKEPEPR